MYNEHNYTYKAYMTGVHCKLIISVHIIIIQMIVFEGYTCCRWCTVH